MMKFFTIITLLIMTGASAQPDWSKLFAHTKELSESLRAFLKSYDLFVDFYANRLNFILKHNIDDYQGIIDEKTM